jgi:hypothetical protein
VDRVDDAKKRAVLGTERFGLSVGFRGKEGDPEQEYDGARDTRRRKATALRAGAKGQRDAPRR